MVIAEIAERVYLDILGPLEITTAGNQYILTFGDNLAKLMDCYAIPNAEGETVAKVLFDQIMIRYRRPIKDQFSQRFVEERI